jgi:hypothetical protein
MRFRTMAIALLPMLLAACGGEVGETERTPSAGEPAAGEAAVGAPAGERPVPAGPPEVGDPAPDFELPGSDGRTHRLGDFRGKKAVVLAWFPKAFTGG